MERPKNPYQREDGTVEQEWLLCYRAFEAGLDARLEALKKEGKHTDGLAPTLSISVRPEQKGWLVFIEDRE